MSNMNKTKGLNKAAKEKRENTILLVKSSLVKMEQESIPINFLSVYKFTGVSRSWLYQEPTIKAMILAAKQQDNNCFMQDQAIKIRAQQKQIDTLTKQNKHLRKRIDELSKQLEVAYGELFKQGK